MGRLAAHKLDAAYLAALVVKNQDTGTRHIYLETDPTDTATATTARQLGR